MDLDVLLRYPAGPQEVAALLADRTFVEELCAASDAGTWTVEVSGTASGPFTVTTERDLPTTDFPDSVRRFVGTSLHVRQVDSWTAPGSGGARSSTTELTVVGAPVTATATSQLRAAAGGSEQAVSGQVRARIPLVGARVEKAAEPALVAALRAQERFVAQRLRS